MQNEIHGDQILLTGGSGTLGKEIQRYLECIAPSSREMDITRPITFLKFKPDAVIHCAAYTDVARAEVEKEKCFDINVKGTQALVHQYSDSYFVYISTEYAVNPVNFYSKTKQWAEEMVRATCKNHLIIRLLFKPNPFPYEYAFADQYTGGDYVDVMTPLIIKNIMLHQTDTIYLHTGKKSMFELARRTKPDIKGNSIHDIKNVRIPEDTFYG